MRLARIKLAGFKSFVDPTTIELPGNRVGVVGPNGCGKSNTIDAVRWVMGESSAKHLRGDSAEDVIFSGSTARKPVGQASVELVFDNSAGRFGGAWEAFAEISVKRVLARDGQSKYWLNGQRARKRDVTDLFLGTGLGPRSYAIIEQGMIARLIEARPEDLRNTIEEAAGISRYKERRRETENRIRHTRENLERLVDLRDEVARQAGRLERQAASARRYRGLAGALRRSNAEAAALVLFQSHEEWHAAMADAKSRAEALEAVRLRVQSLEARRDTAETERELQDATLQKAQEAFYRVQSEAGRLAQDIHNAERELARDLDALAKLEARLERLQTEQNDAHQRCAEAERERDELDIAQREQATALEAINATLRERDQALVEVRETERQWRTSLEAPRTEAQISRERMDRYRAQIERLNARRERVEKQLDALAADATDHDLDARRNALETARRESERLAEAAADTERRLQAQRAAAEQARREWHEAEQTLRHGEGQIRGLETTLEASSDADPKAFQTWCRDHGIQPGMALGTLLEVESGWEAAVEHVLGAWLRAPTVEALSPAGEGGSQPAPPPGTRLVEARAEREAGKLGSNDAPDATRGAASGSEAHPEPKPTHTSGHRWLHECVSPGVSCPSGFERIAVAADRSEAAALLARPDVESVVLANATWVGRGWIRTPGGDAVDGLLERARLLRGLRQQHADAEARVGEARAAVERAEDLQQQLEQSRREHSRQREEQSRAVLRLEQELRRREEQLQAREQQRVALQAEIDDLRRELDSDEAARAQAEQTRNAALTTLENLQSEGAGHVEALEGATEAHRAALAQQQTQGSALAAVESRQAVCANRLQTSQREVERLARDHAETETQAADVRRHRESRFAPLAEWREALQRVEQQRATCETALRDAREALEQTDAGLRELRGEMAAAAHEQDALRAAAEQSRIREATGLQRLNDAAILFRQRFREWNEGLDPTPVVDAAVARDRDEERNADASGRSFAMLSATTLATDDGAADSRAGGGDSSRDGDASEGPADANEVAATGPVDADAVAAAGADWFDAPDEDRVGGFLIAFLPEVDQALAALDEDAAVLGADAAADASDRRADPLERLARVGRGVADSHPPELQSIETLLARRRTQSATLERQIQALGAINLTAIDELSALQERSAWLQAQNDDLVAALETLEKAMGKIDRETRTLFRETFDAVNRELATRFRQLFGGGEARLELTGDDLLETGVAIMARPPGKRLSTIHLMSGGEKSLTAVALVFAIFALNPAPFCMLDEVDAPLDEANVGRFCRLLESMSETIQFVFISHNKATMATAEQLIGVTMAEAGVSRLVSVDIERALELAETVV